MAEETKRKAKEGLANKKTELVFTKEAVEQELKNVGDKLSVAEEKISKLQI